MADYLQTYVTAFDLPVRLNARVTSLIRTDHGFEVGTADDTFQARQIVVATGPFQVPFVPPAAQGLEPAVTQVHSASYRNPDALPGGPVLVVGGGNSGFQIAEELAGTRQVDLSIGDPHSQPEVCPNTEAVTASTVIRERPGRLDDRNHLTLSPHTWGLAIAR